MSRIAVFVDAGYFWVQASHVTHGQKTGREVVTIDFAALRQEVLAQATAQFPNAELLRVYWYDGPGAHGSKTNAHRSIDDLDDFKLRLGSRNGYGEQKAVDGLIIADLIGLAQSKAISGAILLSGDADLTPGVIAAQGLGIRVHLLSMGPTNATSPFLRAEVDQTNHWADPVVQKFVSPQFAALPSAAASTDGSASDESSLVRVENHMTQEVAESVFKELDETARAAALENGSISRTIDSKLLRLGRERVSRVLTDPEKRLIRAEFKRLLTACK